MPYSVYIIGMDFIEMIFLSISIYIFSKTVCEILKPQNLLFEILIIMASYILILNQFSLEYLLFPESAVMCLGVLFIVLAIKILVQKPKFAYLKIFACLLITALSYQGELNIFPLLAILVLVLKQIKENKKIGVFLKELFLEMIKLALITITILAISLVVIKIGKIMLNNTETKFINIINQREFKRRLRIVKTSVNDIWNNCIYTLPKNSFIITIIITSILLLICKAKKQTYFYYFSLNIFAFTISILPLMLFNTGTLGRITVPIMMILGFSTLFILANSIYNGKQYHKNIATIFTILLFSINAMFIIQNTAEHIAANKVDENTGATIKARIEKYEQETGITVTKFGYGYDFEPQQFSVGIKPMQSLTERKFACMWSAEFSMDYYCGRDFEVVEFKYPKAQDYHLNNNHQDYKAFSEEQIYFEGDTVYMIVY